jgi:hypothetical protein
MSGVFGETEFRNVTNQRQGDLVRRLLYGESVTLAIIRKDPKWPGKRLEETKIKVAWGGGGGSDFTSARNNQQPGDYDKFESRQAELYQIGTLEHHEAMSTMTAEGSPLNLVDESLNDAWEGFSQRLSTRLWKDKGMALSKVADISGNVIKLQDPRDTVYFTLNQVLEASVADGNSPADALYAGTMKVTAVDELEGTVTVDDVSTINPPTGLAIGDYVFSYQDFKKGWDGIPAWIPIQNPVPGVPFNNVDRAKYPARLAGTRDTAMQAIRPSLITFLGKIARVGGKPDCLIFNSERHAELISELDANTQYTIEVGGTARDKGPVFSFQAPAIQTQFGLLPILHDRYAPYRYCWAIRKDSWKLKSLGHVPHYSQEDGAILRVTPTQDCSEYRMRGWGNWICEAPFHNGVLDLDGGN